MKNIEKVLNEVKEAIEFMNPEAADTVEAQDIRQIVEARMGEFKYLSKYISEENPSPDEISKEMEIDKFYVERGLVHEIEEVGKRVPLFLDYKNEIVETFNDKIRDVSTMLDYARDSIRYGRPEHVKGIIDSDRYINLTDEEKDQIYIDILNLVEDAFQAGIYAQ
jgi:hypothetical protein